MKKNFEIKILLTIFILFLNTSILAAEKKEKIDKFKKPKNIA